MSRAKKLKGKGLGTSADLPKEIVNRRNELMPKFKKAKEDGRSAFFKRSEPDKLYIKVTVYLQGCLASKRCRASGFSCRYLKPYIKLKLTELAISLYQEF